jgi:TPR repeat protein
LDEFERGHFNEALRLACALIDENFHHANALAGAIFEEGGHGIEPNFEKARFYYQRATETVGSLEAWLGLGRLHFFGKGVPRNLEKAAEYFRIVDEDADNAVAKLMLGRIYADQGTPLYDPKTARTYLRQAADKGSVFAHTHLALLERAQGNWLLSLWLRLKAAVLAFSISRKDSGDPRLRQM